MEWLLAFGMGNVDIVGSFIFYGLFWSLIGIALSFRSSIRHVLAIRVFLIAVASLLTMALIFYPLFSG